MNTDKIRPELMVHAKGPGSMGGAAGVHVGTVDHLDGQYVKLAKTDSEDGRHHWIPLDWVEKVDDKAIYLNKTAEEVTNDQWDEDPSQMRNVI